jgi:glycosyltransferase involved in cell wall biosynthesis/thymidylate kinase
VHSDVQHFDPRLKILFQIFAELERAGSEFALIHGDNSDWPSVTSDVDIAFSAPPPAAIEPVLRKMSAAGTISILQRLHYDVPYAYYYILLIPGPSPIFLHLDCLFDPIGINKYLLPTPMLLKDAAKGEFGWHSGKPQKVVYLLLKRAIKGKISAQGLASLRNQFSSPTDALWSEVENWFGPTSRPVIERLLVTEDPAGTEIQLAALASEANRLFLRRHPIRFIVRFLLDLWRKARRFFQPTGLFVVLVGPDGSGKSTLAKLLITRLERGFRRTWWFHWRPNFLPKLRQSSDEPNSANTAPADKSKYRGVVSLIRFIYYWLDFVIGYWLIIYPKKAQTTLVVGERYFPDVIVHPQRYGFDVPTWLLRLASKLVPSPDLLVLLTDQPEVIFARKSELSPATITSQIAAFERELPQWGNTAIVQTSGGIEAVFGRVSDLIFRECSRRVENRLKSQILQNQWHAFPSASNVKIWVNDQDTLRNALSLYQPYLRYWQVVKSVINIVPKLLQRLLFRDRPDPETALRLDRLTQAIRKNLLNDNFVVSFLCGTPGPHQKLTAQASLNGKVIAYVKIGNVDAVGEVLRHEAKTLDWLKKQSLLCGHVPRVSAIERDADDILLFLSSPKIPARKRSHQADAKDASFLSLLASLSPETIDIAQVFEAMGLNAYLAQINETDANGAAIVRRSMTQLSEHFENQVVKVALGHGDYAPWNTLELEDGNLFVIDWEYSRNQAPVLDDLFHRLYMPARYVRHLQPIQVVDELVKGATQLALDPRNPQSISVDRSDVLYYALMYLLGRLARRQNGMANDDFLFKVIAFTSDRASGTASRKKVLVSAYACEPGRGSEPGVGWRMCEAISRECDAWIITRKNNKGPIEREMRKTPHPNMHFSYVDLPPWARFWKKGERGVRVYYYLWQFAAWWEAQKLIRTVKFDVAQHVTFVNDYMGTFLALLPIPFVWGPIGSPGKRPGQVWNSFFKLIFERREYYLKNCIRALDPLLWLSAIRAKVVVGVNNDICTRFPLNFIAADKYVSHTAIGVENALIDVTSRHINPENEFRVISVGRLIRIKNVEISIRAFALLSQYLPTARFTVVGDGRLKPYLEQLVKHLNIEEKVEFVGLISRAEVMVRMSQSDVFLFPSYEAEGMVVLEALAQGLPVVCLNYGGPGKMVTPACGFAVEVDAQDRMIEKLGNALSLLASDRNLWREMSDAARRHIEQNYLWENRHLTIRKWYSKAGVEVTTNPSDAK